MGKIFAGDFKAYGHCEGNGVVMQATRRETGKPHKYGAAYKATANEVGVVKTQKVSYGAGNADAVKAVTSADAKIIRIAAACIALLSVVCLAQILITRANEGYLLPALITLSTLVYLASDMMVIAWKRFRYDEEMIEFCKYYAAMNAVYNAAEVRGEVPSLTEVKMASIYGPYHYYFKQINPKMLTALAAATISLCFVAHLPSCIVLMAATLYATYRVSYNNHFMLWQSLIVVKPDDRHYKAAIAALEASMADLEKELKN